MKRIKKDEYYLNIALAVSKRSTCLKRHYGCVIVNNDEIIATGYNGSPRGEDNCCDVYDECPRKNVEHNSGDYSGCSSVHAEQNAMLSASRRDMIGATLYLVGEEELKFCGSSTTTLCNDCGKLEIECPFKQRVTMEIKDCTPCPICLRMIKNAGIKKIVTRKGVEVIEY